LPTPHFSESNKSVLELVSGSDQAIHGIFADNDSENEDEFEGLGPGDIYIDLNNENSRTDLLT
jgi:hypothetical protein